MVYGRVYSIRSHQTIDIYIGSTTQTLSQRMTDHRKTYKSYLNGICGYVSSYEILPYEDAYIELLFEGEFESKYALMKKEGEYIREMKCVNKVIPGRTSKEYRDEHKDKAKEYSIKWREENKEYKVELDRKYREEHKTQLASKKKKYREDHPEEEKARHAKNYEKNKEKEKIDKGTKYTCECGTTICKGDKARHERSQKHKKLMLCLSSEGNCDEVRSSSGQSSENSEVVM